MTERKEWEVALSKAKIRLMTKKDSVFFTTLCFSLQHLFDDKVPTAATNGKVIKYNPAFFMELSTDEQIFLMLHETMHCAYLHMFRAKQLGLNPRKANIAADHVINLQLIERGFKMPEGGLADPQYTGMSKEKIYKLLPDNPEPPPMEDLLDPGEENQETTTREIEDALVRAAMQSKLANDKPGTIPGEIEIFLNKLLNPKLPYTTLLRKYLQSYSKNDFTWRRPNRRYMPDHYLPSLHSQSLIDIAVAIDASGSVSDTQFLQFVSDIHSIFKTVKPKKITLIHFDTSIRGVTEIKDMRDLSQVKFTGRGGTNIVPLMEWAEEHRPQLLMVFTDGYFPFPAVTYSKDSLWLIHNNPNWSSPIGKTIHYSLEQ